MQTIDSSGFRSCAQYDLYVSRLCMTVASERFCSMLNVLEADAYYFQQPFCDACPFFQKCLFELPYGRSFLPELRRNLSLF